jgi:sulfide:quinone oxidoreductase
MSRVVVLGAGIAGHTAASYLQKYLGKEHEIVVVSPTSTYQWIPSNIWVGVGRMTPEEVKFDLRPLYKKWGIEFLQAKATTFYPEGNNEIKTSFIQVEFTSKEQAGETRNIAYDF